ncbi:MAG: SIR2 family NAD-dependent protein deacylase [Egibacteraceae bacterium]
MDEADWARLIDQLGDGRVTPFIGAGAVAPALPAGATLSRHWAKAYRYPFDDESNLPRVMDYIAVTSGDSIYLKQRVSRDLSMLGPPDFAKLDDPHTLLAELPIPVFLTTNYDDFMAQALVRAGKRPHLATCPWNYEGGYDRKLFDTDTRLDPQADEPLVYHFHGRLQDPASLVLTEDDYLEFLVNITADRAMDDRRLVPLAILWALTSCPILFIGYDFNDWTCRVLFHGLLRSFLEINPRRHVAVQPLPPVNKSDVDAQNSSMRYITRYLESRRISVFWGTVAEFCTELRARMRPA